MNSQMTKKIVCVAALGVLVPGAAVLGLAGQARNKVHTANRGATAQREKSATHSPAEAMEPKTVTLTGRIVDLHCFMTNRYASNDHAKCTAECIKAGVPAALETPTGLVLLGEGMKGAAEKLASMAFQRVDVHGKLYDAHGIKYLEFTSMNKSTSSASAAPTDHSTPTKTVAKDTGSPQGTNPK